MNNITFKKGNIFSSDKQTIVNTINCVGVMGKGVALGFRLRYPEMYEKYKEFCKNKQIAIGKLWLYKQPQEGSQWVLNFPTKFHWKYPSKMEYLKAGLQKFVDTYEEKGITSIAFPLLGTHNGGLDKIEVLDMMHSYLEKCLIPIDIYEYDPAAPDELMNNHDIITQSLGLQQANDPEYVRLVSHISDLWDGAKNKAVYAVNAELINANWQTGQYIVEFEQGGNAKAKYGDKLLVNLSKDLTRLKGRGFSRSNLNYMRKLYLAFPICETLSHKLTWSHYFELLKCDDPLEMKFYMKECIKEGWKVRELKRQINSSLFQRLALSTDKEGVLALANEGHQVMSPADIIRDPYVLEFTGIPQQKRYKESDLEKALKTNMEQFLLELGRGFAFMGRQYIIPIGSRHFKVDLVFYNAILKCYVLIDLKRGEIKHGDIGQMNLYLNYFKNEICQPDDNPPIGIVLGAKKDELLMEYALQGIDNQLFAARYQLYLPNREELQTQLDLLLDNSKENR